MALYNYWHWSSWKHPAFGLKPSDHHLASLGLFFSKPNSWLAKCVYPSQSLGTKRLGCHLEVGEMVALPEAEVLAVISASNACSLAESRSQGPCHELALEKVFGSHSPLSCWIKVQTSCQGRVFGLGLKKTFIPPDNWCASLRRDFPFSCSFE